jgi:hypothetical protein
MSPASTTRTRNGLVLEEEGGGEERSEKCENSHAVAASSPRRARAKNQRASRCVAWPPRGRKMSCLHLQLERPSSDDRAETTKLKRWSSDDRAETTELGALKIEHGSSSSQRANTACTAALLPESRRSCEKSHCVTKASTKKHDAASKNCRRQKQPIGPVSRRTAALHPEHQAGSIAGPRGADGNQ